MLKTKTPDNIDSLSFQDIVKLIPANLSDDLPKPANRMKVIRIIFQILGYDLSPDLALALCAEPLSQLIIATAGGGKTTGAQIGAILQKIWRKSKRNPSKKITGDKILCLVYNKHNVKPMESKHKALVNRLRMANISDLNIDDEINAATMHSFCDQIRKENVANMGLIGFRLQSDVEASTVMKTVKSKILNKHRVKENPSEEDLISLYNYARESMLSVEQLEQTDKFQDVHLSVEVLSDIFFYYDKLKVAKRRYDYVDLLTGVYKLLSSDEKILQKTQRYFEYIIADEIQDFTPIMMSILQLFVSNGTPLMCIGDEDQGIYNFRGADIYNTLDFTSKFEDAEVYSLTRNRRCAEKILTYAKEIISENTLRYNKIITGVRSGGSVEMIPYNSIEAEHLKLINMIKQLPEEVLDDSVIAYRDRNSSLMLTEMLAEEDIPFYVLSGYEAYSHPLYKALIEVFNALESPYDKALSLSLYKVLPIKRDEIFNVFGYDPSAKRFKTDTKQHFASYDYGRAMSINGFAEAMETLKKLSNDIQNKTMDCIFPTVFKLLNKYYWKLLRRDRENLTVYDDFIEMRVDKVFNQHKSYQAVFNNITTKQERCRRDSRSKNGIAVSTFHCLKGLEFTNCYLIDLDNNKFPNFPMIDMKPYSEEAKRALKECETRLFYVAVTRAKDNLFLFYNEENPSRYLLNHVKSPKYEALNKKSALSSQEIAQIFGDALVAESKEMDFFNKKEPEIENIITEEVIESDLLDLLDDEEVIIEEPSNSLDDSLLDLLEEDNIMEIPPVTQQPTHNNLQQIDSDFVNLSSSSSQSSFIKNLISNLGG